MSDPLDACRSLLTSVLSARDPVANFLPNLASTFLGALLGVMGAFFVNTKIQAWKDKREVREIKTALGGEVTRAISAIQESQRATFLRVAEVEASFLELFLTNSKCVKYAPASLLAASFRYKGAVEALTKLLALHDDALEADDLAALGVRAGVVSANSARSSEQALQAAIELHREVNAWRI